MNDGTFGVTAELQEIEPELVEAIEAHEFDPVKGLYWRNRDLSFNSIRDLQMSLEERPREEVLIRKREAEDQRALESLARMPEPGLLFRVLSYRPLFPSLLDESLDLVFY